MKPSRIWFDDRRNAVGWRLPSGVPVSPSLGFVFPVALVAFLLVLNNPRNGWVLALPAGPVVFASVLAHEAAHMLEARRFGIPTIAIRIFDTGGVAELAPGFGARLWTVSLAGPVADLLIGAVLLGIRLALPEPVSPIDPRFHSPPPQPPTLADDALFYAGWFNVLLGGANLLPAYPLDGGHILHEALEPLLGERRTRIVVGSLGLLCAVFSTVVFVASLVAGFAFWLPPSFAPQMAAIFPGRRKPPEPPADDRDDPDDRVVPFRRDPPLPRWLRRR